MKRILTSIRWEYDDDEYPLVITETPEDSVVDADHPGGRHLVPREPGRHVAVPRHQLAAAELLVVDLGNDKND